MCSSSASDIFGSQIRSDLSLLDNCHARGKRPPTCWRVLYALITALQLDLDVLDVYPHSPSPNRLAPSRLQSSLPRPCCHFVAGISSTELQLTGITVCVFGNTCLYSLFTFAHVKFPAWLAIICSRKTPSGRKNRSVNRPKQSCICCSLNFESTELIRFHVEMLGDEVLSTMTWR